MGSLLHILQHTFATLLLIFPYIFFEKGDTKKTHREAAMIWDMFSTSVILIDLDGAQNTTQLFIMRIFQHPAGDFS